MSSPRHPRFLYVVGTLLVLIVVVASLVPGKDLPHLGISDKIEHIIAYFGLAAWFGGLLMPRRYVQLGVALLLLGGGIEIAQGLMGLGRQADWYDFYADAFGVLAGLLLCLLGLRHWASWVERWLRPS
jgi:VanZ family protein